MLLKLLDNRVRRSYSASGLINDYTEYMPLNYPEDWIASVVEAFNPGFEKTLFKSGIISAVLRD